MSQKISKITRMDTVYNSLMEDEIHDKTPKKLMTVSRNRNFFRSSRNLFRNSSKTLKICRKNASSTENTKNKIRVLMDELQNKIQFWSQVCRIEQKILKFYSVSKRVFKLDSLF